MKQELSISEGIETIERLEDFDGQCDTDENRRFAFERTFRQGKLNMVASPNDYDKKDAVLVLLVEQIGGAIVRVPLGRLENAALAKLCVDALT